MVDDRDMTRDAGRVDQAAVLGVALAASVSVSAADGPWEPLESIVGLVLVGLLVAYIDAATVRGRGGFRRRAAVTGVAGLSICLTFAWPVQWLLNLLGRPNWIDGVLVALWVVATLALFTVLSGRRSRSRRRSPAG
jgi:hypothetical protein